MVDLPRTRLDVVSPGAQPSVGPGYVKSAFSELSRGLESLGNTLGSQQMQSEEAQAHIEGTNAVYRDDKGGLTFNPRPLDRTGIEYNNAALSSYLARQHPESVVQMTQGAANANGNVAAFETWYKGYKTQMLKGKPPIISGPLTTLLDNEYNSQREGMIRRQDAIDVRAQEQSLRQSIELSNQDATDLASTGGTDTPEYKAKLADITSQMNQLESNPLFGFTKAQGDVMLRRFEAQHTGEYLVGKTKQIYEDTSLDADGKPNGGLQKARDFALHGFDDPKLPMDPASRRRYQSLALAGLRQFSADQIEMRRDAREGAKILTEAIKNGPFPADDAVDAAVQKLAAAGAGGEATQLLRAYNLGKFNQGNNALTPQERADAFQRMQQGDTGAAGGQDLGFFKQRTQGVSDAAIAQTNPIFRERLATALEAAEQATGGKASISSMFRTGAEQQAAYDRYKSGQGGLAAPPGHSRHEIGEAADLADGPVRQWLHQHASEYGLEFLPGKAGAVDPGHIQLASGEPTAAGVPSGAATLIGQFEGLRLSSYPDKGGYRIGYGSDTITRADGTVERVRPGMTITQADAERDRARRVPIFEAQERAQVGTAAWDSLDGNTRAALTSVAYNYGSLPPEVVAAVKTGDKENIAAAVEGLEANPGRRRQEAAIIRGKPIAGGATDPYDATGAAGAVGLPYDPEIYKAARKRITDDFNTHWADMTKGWVKGFPPPPEDMALIAEQAGLTGDPGVIKKVQDWFNSGILDMPRESIAAMNAGIAKGLAQGLDADHNEVLQAEIAIRDHVVDQFTKPDGDPYDMAVRYGSTPEPRNLDFSTPISTQGSIADRIQGSRRISGVYGVGPVTAFSKADALAFNTAVASGDPQQVSNALKSFAQMPTDIMLKTLAMPQVKQAITGAIGSRNFPLWDQAMRTVDLSYARASADTERVLGKDAIDALNDWQGKERYYSPQQMQEQFDKMDDPSFAKQQKQLLEDGLQVARDEGVKDFGGTIIGHRVSVPNIVSALESTANKLSPALGGQYAPVDPQTLNVLRSDYEKIYAERFAALQDRDKARAQTIERLSHVWGFSASNGGKLMLHPPENFDNIPEMKAVNGSKDWMGEQLDHELRAAGYVGEANVVHLVGPNTRAVLPHAIIADAQTQAEIDNGDKPSYAVVVVDKDGNYAVPLAFGNVKRFVFDNRRVPIDRSNYERTHALSDKLNEGAPTLEAGAGFGTVDPGGVQPVPPAPAEGGGGIGRGGGAGTQLVPESPGTLESLRPPAAPAIPPVQSETTLEPVPPPEPQPPFEPQSRGRSAPRPGSLKSLKR